MSLDFCEAVGSEGGAHPLDQLFPSHRGKPVKKVRLVPAEKAFSFARKLQVSRVNQVDGWRQSG